MHIHPFLHPDPAFEPTHASAAGLLAQLVERLSFLQSRRPCRHFRCKLSASMKLELFFLRQPACRLSPLHPSPIYVPYCRCLAPNRYHFIPEQLLPYLEQPSISPSCMYTVFIQLSSLVYLFLSLLNFEIISEIIIFPPA